MRSVKAILIASSVLAITMAGLTPPASAATTWDFPSGSFTLSDGLGGTAGLTITNLQVNGTTATGTVTLSNGRHTCTTRSMSGLTATFTLGGQYDPCYGSVTFAVSSGGLLTVSSSSVYIPTTLLTWPGSETVQGVGPQVTSCVVTVTGDQAVVTWDATGSGITSFTVGVVNGAQAAVDVGGIDRKATVSLVGEKPGSLTMAIEINQDDTLIFSCPDFVYSPQPGKPSIDSLVPASGGLLTVNYSVAQPTTVQGIEHRVDAGPWSRPGGQAPVNGSGGSFTLTGLSAGQHTVALRSVGFDSVKTTEGTPAATTIPATKPANLSAAPAIGSSPKAPVAAPPAQPTSNVAGTSNGAGTGTNGALAANTGDAGIDAPCLAQDGTLYPTLYSTVGSQLTMAPNTHGMGKVKSFSVVGGALPAGMQLDRTYGVVFGVPTQAGSWTTTVRAKLAGGATKDGQFTTRVDVDPQTLQYAAQNIGSIGARISISATTNAPVTGTTYTLVCGKLPAGTKFDPRTGRILGTPTKVVSRPIPLRVAESSNSGNAAASFLFVVDKAGTQHLSYPSHPHARPGKRITIRPTVSGAGDIKEFRTWKGKLPKGLRLNHRTGVITGRVAHSGPTRTITLVAETRGGALLTAAPMKLSLRR